MIQNCTTYKIMKVFFDFPLKKFSLKDVSFLSKIAHTSVKKELLDLKRKNIVKVESEKKGKRIFPIYSALLSEDFFRIKKILNEYNIITSGLVEYLRDETMPNSIVLFGSFSKGEDNEESDVDLFVESGLKQIDLKKYEKRLNRKINIIYKGSVKDLSEEFLENIINGTVLYGEIKIK